MISIAIIGGGLGGISAFSQLVKKNIIAHYTIYEPGAIAYASSLRSSSGEHLCNTSVLVNSLFKDNPFDFLYYLKQQGYPVSGESFVPRFLLLQYARETFAKSLIAARNAGSVVDCIKRKIVSFETQPEHQCNLFDEDGNQYHHDFAFFSPGPPPTQDGAHTVYSGDNRVSGSSPEKLDSFAINKKNIAIIGTKLSAIDSALVLCRKGIKVTMFSTSGELPAVRTELVYHPEINESFVNTKVTFSKRNFIKIINDNTYRIRTDDQRHIKNPHKLLSNDILRVKHGKANWQNSVASIIDYANTHLKNAPTPLKDSVMRRTKPLISRYISSIPLENALKVQRLIENSMVKIEKGKLQDFSLHDGTVMNNKKGMQFDGLLIATGTKNFKMCKSGDKFIINNIIPEASEKVTPNDIKRINKAGIWLSGSLLNDIYPIVNYLKFCVDQAFFFSQTFEER